jgi:hypothetical protein
MERKTGISPKNGGVSDRVKPSCQCSSALETAVFAVSERTVLTETLLGTRKDGGAGSEPVIEVKNPGK